MAQRVRNLLAMQEIWGSFPGLGRCPRVGIGYPLQYSCLENSMDRGAWWATVHSVTKSQFILLNFPGGSVIRICLQCGRLRRRRRCKRQGFHPWVGKISWRRKWQPSLVFLLGKLHGQRSLEGYSPWDCKESDMTEWLRHTHTCYCSGEASTFTRITFLTT